MSMRAYGGVAVSRPLRWITVNTLCASVSGFVVWECDSTDGATKIEGEVSARIELSFYLYWEVLLSHVVGRGV